MPTDDRRQGPQLMSGGLGLRGAPPLASRQRSKQRQTWLGFTIIELAIVLAILGVVGSAIGLTLLRQQRFYRGATELLYAREGVRDAMEILSTDIRGMSTADTAMMLSDSAVEVFPNIRTSALC